MPGMLTLLTVLNACDSTSETPAGGGSYRGAMRQRDVQPAPGPAPAPEPKPVKTHPTDTNVLVIVLDDVGVDKVQAYGVSESAPPTPALSRLASEGRLFRHAWVQPLCSVSRAALMTGRYPRRTGVGHLVDHYRDEPELDEAEISIPEMLDRSGKDWHSSFVGKWHLNSARGRGVPRAPGRQGFDWYRFLPGNLREGNTNGSAKNYERWDEIDNGEPKEMDGYILRHQADDAIARIDEMPEPWFLWTAFTGVHVPLTPPPAKYYGNLGVTEKSSEQDLYDAVLRALDVEVGRVVASLTAEQRARTTIIVLSDNGTPDHAIRPPLDPKDGKGSVMELGVRVPFIVTGPLVEEPGPTDALVSNVDVFATIADVAGVDVSELGVPIDGVSFYSSLKKPKGPGARTTVYTEKFLPNGNVPYTDDIRAIRDERWKLVVDVVNGVEQERFYDLSGKEVEAMNLLRDGALGPAQSEARARLRAEHDRLLAEMGGGGGTHRPGLPIRAPIP
jgi:arylsulfatase A-like enzyme